MKKHGEELGTIAQSIMKASMKELKEFAQTVRGDDRHQDEDSEEDILLDRIMVLENRLSRMRDDDGDETANKRRKILEKTLCRAYDKLDKCQENKED